MLNNARCAHTELDPEPPTEQDQAGKTRRGTWAPMRRTGYHRDRNTPPERSGRTDAGYGENSYHDPGGRHQGGGSAMTPDRVKKPRSCHLPMTL